MMSFKLNVFISGMVSVILRIFQPKDGGEDGSTPLSLHKSTASLFTCEHLASLLSFTFFDCG